MTVLMTLRVSADPKAIEDTPSDVLQAIGEKAKSLGATKHHFYGSDKEVFVDRRVAGRGDVPAVLRLHSGDQGA